MVDSEDTSLAWSVGEVDHLRASVDGGPETVVAEADVALGLVQSTRSRTADGHTETLEAVSIVGSDVWH